MSEHPNVATARHMLEAVSAGRVDLTGDMYADDAVLHLAGNNPTSGTYRGRAEIAAGLTKMYQLFTTGGFHVEVEPAESILASDGHMMLFFRAQVQRNGDTLDHTIVVAATMDPQGKYRELWFLTDNQAQTDRFWS